MKEAKKPSHVKGVRDRCINFQMCPLCFGCRAYSSHDLKCRECKEENEKQNICNTELHKSDIINKMVSKSIIVVDEPIIFKNSRK